MIKNKVESVIKTFFEVGWSKQDFLTEDDIRCNLYNHFKTELKDINNISIHAEVRWYGDEKKLKYRSDIVIIDKNDLVINNSIVFKLPSKGYGFNKYYSIIEIKLRRPNDTNSDLSNDKIVKKDIIKLMEIKEATTKSFNTIEKKYFMIAYDKKRNKKMLLDVNENNKNNDINWIDW